MEKVEELERRIAELENTWHELAKTIIPKTEEILRDQDKTIQLLREHSSQLATLLGLMPFRQNN